MDFLLLEAYGNECPLYPARIQIVVNGEGFSSGRDASQLDSSAHLYYTKRYKEVKFGLRDDCISSRQSPRTQVGPLCPTRNNSRPTAAHQWTNEALKDRGLQDATSIPSLQLYLVSEPGWSFQRGDTCIGASS